MGCLWEVLSLGAGARRGGCADLISSIHRATWANVDRLQFAGECRRRNAMPRIRANGGYAPAAWTIASIWDSKHGNRGTYQGTWKRSPSDAATAGHRSAYATASDLYAGAEVKQLRESFVFSHLVPGTTQPITLTAGSAAVTVRVSRVQGLVPWTATTLPLLYSLSVAPGLNTGNAVLVVAERLLGHAVNKRVTFYGYGLTANPFRLPVDSNPAIRPDVRPN